MWKHPSRDHTHNEGNVTPLREDELCLPGSPTRPTVQQNAPTGRRQSGRNLTNPTRAFASIASRLTFQLERFFSWRQDSLAETTDAFQQDWMVLLEPSGESIGKYWGL